MALFKKKINSDKNKKGPTNLTNANKDKNEEKDDDASDNEANVGIEGNEHIEQNDNMMDNEPQKDDIHEIKKRMLLFEESIKFIPDEFK